MNLSNLLSKVASGELSPEDASAEIRDHGIADLGFARVDLHRKKRCGMPETIFCEGKTPRQVADIVTALKEAGQHILATRASKQHFDAVVSLHPEAVFHESARAITLDVGPLSEPVGSIAVVSAGTSDQPVAEEAALVAERMGAKVERIYDVGVAGIHRLVHHLDTLKKSSAVVVVAGMEGALPSVIGGLIDKPVIAVPTSIGYGMNLQGVSALLAMLNSCVPGITVVNVDNGFGAGVAAAMINRNAK
ncbi:MAG: nickel pincer cofactor biosynthesis protein LarB [Verrucomicrobia bacterium]|nr:nickel pincer cofactor biosynthesis protein LarB [Verrucomicrobiota bacterium]